MSNPSQAAARPNAWIWIALLVLALLLTARIWKDLATGPSAGDGVALRDEVTEDGVRVRSMLERNRFEAGGEATLWITIEHRGDGQVISPRIAAVEAPGFTTAGPCWRGRCPGPGCVPACAVGSDDSEDLPASLDPGRAVSRWARLRAGTDVAAARTVTVTVAWEHRSDPTAPLSQRQVFVHLGPVAVEAGDRLS